MNATGRPAASLEEAITSLHTLEEWRLGEADLNATLATMATARRMLDTLIGRYALHADSRDTWREAGYVNVADMIAHTAPLSVSEAQQLVGRRKRIEGTASQHETYQLLDAADTRGAIPARHAEIVARFLTKHVNRLPDDAKAYTVAALIARAMDPDTAKLNADIATLEGHLDRGEGKPDPGEDRDLDSLHLSPLLNGRYKLDANLGKACAEMLLTLLDAVGKPQTGEEGSPLQRRPEQLRCDSFEELLRRIMAFAEALPEKAGARPQVTVTAGYESVMGEGEDEPGLFDLDLDPNTAAARDDDTDDDGVDGDTESDPDQLTLFDLDLDLGPDTTDTADAHAAKGGSGAGCCDDHGHGHAHTGNEGEGLWWSGRRGHGANIINTSLDDSTRRMFARLAAEAAKAPRAAWTGTMSRRQLRMYACDATLRAVLTDPTGLPLDMGRNRRTHSAEQRRYLVLRDKGCAFPGCRRSASWCDVHHVIWWSRGGSTDRRNLILLCNHHHHLVHQGMWEVRMDEFEVPWFTPPSGYDPLRRPIPGNGRIPRSPTPTAA